MSKEGARKQLPLTEPWPHGCKERLPVFRIISKSMETEDRSLPLRAICLVDRRRLLIELIEPCVLQMSPGLCGCSAQGGCRCLAQEI